MTEPATHEPAPPAAPAGERADPELEALPQPRRPGRNATIAVMAITLVASLMLALALRGEAWYAVQGGQPADVGELANFQTQGAQPGAWIRGEAQLAPTGAIRYARPLDPDTYRLAPVNGNERLWVEIRVPTGFEGPYFVPPSSFVGRLVPSSRVGLRHRALAGEVQSTWQRGIPEDAWLLIDGESPHSLRWALGVVVLALGFGAFNLFGLYRLLRPVRDD